MYPFFLEVCKKHDVVVTNKPSIVDAMRGHLSYLSKLNTEELTEVLQHMHDHHD
jgi:hypothetical protein